TSVAKHAVNPIVAEWVAQHDQMAGAGTDTLPNATALFVPLIGSQRTVGAVGIRPADTQHFLDPDQRRLLETCASLIALSIERDQSVLQAHDAHLQVQAEQLRSSLLSSVSHDLRTPLATIAGASSSLLEGTTLAPDTRVELLQSIVDESQPAVAPGGQPAGHDAAGIGHRDAQQAMARAGGDRRVGADAFTPGAGGLFRGRRHS